MRDDGNMERVYIGSAFDDDGRPLKQWLNLPYANRHGLITGATGTGKTVTLQILAEGLSDAGVPVFAADVKGDLAGLSQPGEPPDGPDRGAGGRAEHRLPHRRRGGASAARPEGSAGASGEPALDIRDFMRTTRDGRGCINILAADKLMQSPQLYATFLLWLLSELFEELGGQADPLQGRRRLFRHPESARRAG